MPHPLGRPAVWRPERVVAENGSPNPLRRNHVRDPGVDLTVLGMHGRNAILEPIAGRVARTTVDDTIMDDAPCDVPVIQEPSDADART